MGHCARGELDRSGRGHGTASLLVEAIVAALAALGFTASLRTGKTIAPSQWRIPYIASRRSDPFDYWFVVGVLGAVTGYFAIDVAIHDATALVEPALGAVVTAGTLAAVPKSAWRAIGEFFIGPPVKPVMKAKTPHASGRQASVAVRGWARAELQRIIVDFSSRYDVPESAIELDARTDGVSTLIVPGEITPETLCFLVNYLNYPNGFDLTGRSIGVSARTALPRGFGPPDLVGKRALIYVPSDDAEYDQVYVQCADKSYQVRLADFRWQVTVDARMPTTITGL